MTTHYLVPALAIALLTGCGMAETTAVTAAQAEAAVETAKEAEQIKAKLTQDIAAAQEASVQRIEAAEGE